MTNASAIFEFPAADRSARTAVSLEKSATLNVRQTSAVLPLQRRKTKINTARFVVLEQRGNFEDAVPSPVAK